MSQIIILHVLTIIKNNDIMIMKITIKIGLLYFKFNMNKR